MRAVDKLLECLNKIEDLSDIEKEILRHRIIQMPTKKEYEAAVIRLAREQDNKGWIDITVIDYIERSSNANDR